MSKPQATPDERLAALRRGLIPALTRLKEIAKFEGSQDETAYRVLKAEYYDCVKQADVVHGRETGRAHAEDITLFKSVGLALEDLAVAVRILEKARIEGIGLALPY